MHSKLTFRNLSTFFEGGSPYSISLAFGQENARKMLVAFFRPSSTLLSTVPCRTYSKEICGDYCPRNTLYVEGENRFLSYCPRLIAKDETIADEELRVFRPNLHGLLLRSAEALEIRPCVTESGIDGVWRIGEYSPSAARKHPVFFIAHTLGEAIRDAVCQLLLEHSAGSLVIFCLHNAPLDAGTMRVLQNRGSLFIDIDECMNLSFDGKVTLKVESKSIFASIAGRGDVRANPSFGYDFPVGTTWEDLLIHCQDDPEKVAFKIGNTTSVHTRAEMKIGKTQWGLLRIFAEKHGRLPSTAILQKDALKKQRERLNKNLKDYFRTSQDAIVLSDDRSEYVCRFVIKPSWHSTIHHVKKRA